MPRYERKEDTVFDEYRNGFQKTSQISYYVKTNWNNTYFSLQQYEDYYYFFEKCCKEKKITIINPLTNKPMSTDVYFITTIGNYYGFPMLICNYYFIEEDFILGISLGTAELGMYTGFVYLIDYNNNNMNIFLHIYVENYTNEYTDSLFYMKENIKKMNMDNIPIKIKTIYGLYCASSGHNYFNDFTGIYVMHKMGFKNIIDDVVIGPNDSLNIENILKEEHDNIRIINVDNVFDYNNQVGRGVFFSYNHFYISNNCALYFKECLGKNFTLPSNVLTDIEYIKNNYGPIFTFQLRIGSHGLVSCDTVISETINSLIKIYPNAFFILDGWHCNTKLENKKSHRHSVSNNDTYDSLKTDYNNMVNSLISKLDTNNYRSIIGCNIYTSIKYSEIVNFGINFNTTSNIMNWTLKIPGITFGRTNIYHLKGLDDAIAEDFPKIEYFTDEITFFKDNGTDKFSIESFTIVKKVIQTFQNL
jgi:hypothetical protein